MAIRTVEEYKESLRDGRRVYIMGEKVEDVTRHPVLGPTVDLVGAAYELCASEDPEIRDLYVAPHPETGEPISRYYITPRTTEDLAVRSKMIQRSIALAGDLPFGRDIGTDCLNAAFVVAGKMGNEQYQQNAVNFLEYLRKNDLFTCGAVTCVKGDRSKEPANQKHPDYYVHVVDKNKDGIIVKGAKAHITSA
ncbi:MAG TPA: 4-hydroxyphenylacetate 3-hydroxylase N-terminal domain-containing protein, partial [Deltaproteobacteria bacterium]|nr:4-hydroxyphenylacetate 3-hydroxylase N-terminal domain-containing protein [Deltaproteobacteria bacterium]